MNHRLPASPVERAAAHRLARALDPTASEELALSKALVFLDRETSTATFATLDDAWSFHWWARQHHLDPQKPTLQEPFAVRYGRVPRPGGPDHRAVGPLILKRAVTSRNGIHYLYLFADVVVGCMGDNPVDFIGLTFAQAKHLNRYGRLPAAASVTL